MRTKKGVLQVLELLAKLNREIGSRADEAPAVRIVIGGNIPLEGMRAVTHQHCPCRQTRTHSPARELTAGARAGRRPSSAMSSPDLAMGPAVSRNGNEVASFALPGLVERMRDTELGTGVLAKAEGVFADLDFHLGRIGV
jgi:hypothetical protein